MNKLSRKDIAMLEVLAVTEESKGKLAEYVQQREKAAKAYKAFREAVVNGVEVEKVEKVVEVKRKFRVGDKVRVLDTSFFVATSALDVGDITKVVGYKEDFEEYELLAPEERPVVVAEPEGETGLFEESALELVVVKPIKPKRKFKTGDKVRVLDTENPIVPLGLGVGDVTEVLKYSLGGVVVVKTPRQSGYAFRESSLELVEEKTPNELRAEIIQRMTDDYNRLACEVLSEGEYEEGTE